MTRRTRHSPAAPDRYLQPWRRRLRWEQTPLEPWIRNSSIVAVLCMTVIVVIGFHRGMRIDPVRLVPRAPVQVSLIDAAPVFPVPDLPIPPPLPRGRSVPVAPAQATPTLPEHSARQGERATSARSADSEPAQVRLFEQDGSIRMPQQQEPATTTARERARQEWADLQQRGHNVVDCERTLFSDNYTPDESLGDGVTRKYLSWIGLVDHEVLRRNAERRRPRHACD